MLTLESGRQLEFYWPFKALCSPKGKSLHASTCKIWAYLCCQKYTKVILQFQSLHQQPLGIIFSGVSVISCWDPQQSPRQPQQIKIKYSHLNEANPITDFCFYLTFAIKYYFYCPKPWHLGCIFYGYRLRLRLIENC